MKVFKYGIFRRCGRREATPEPPDGKLWLSRVVTSDGTCALDPLIRCASTKRLVTGAPDLLLYVDATGTHAALIRLPSRR